MGQTGRKDTPETRKKKSVASKLGGDRHRTPQARENHKAANIAMHKDPLKHAEAVRKNHTDVSRKKQSVAGKRLWADPVTRVKMSKDPREALKRYGGGMNKPERLMFEILQELQKDAFRYRGDFSFFIGGRCPDFVDVATQRCIEVYGDYWHANHDPQARIDYFGKRGWRCLVIWESELLRKREETIIRVRQFVG